MEPTFSSTTGTAEKQPQLQEQGATGVLLKECVGTRLKTNLP